MDLNPEEIFLNKVIILALSLFSTACSGSVPSNDSMLLEQCAGKSVTAGDAVLACEAIMQSTEIGSIHHIYAVFNRGKAYFRLNEFQKSVDDFSSVIALKPGEHAAYASRGVSYGTMGETIRAAADFEMAVKLNKNDDVAFANLGHAYEKLNEFDKSFKALNASLALNPDNLIALADRCWVRAVLGIDLEEALADCDKAINITPQDPNLYNSRGFIRFRAGNFDKAIAEYTKSIQGNPNIGSSYYVRGLAYAAIGHTELAKADALKAIELEPGVAERYRKYGVIAK